MPLRVILPRCDKLKRKVSRWLPDARWFDMISLTHPPLNSSNLFFRLFKIVLFAASTCLFPIRYRGVDVLKMNFPLFIKFLKFLRNELRTIINQNFVWYAMLAYDILPNKFLHHSDIIFLVDLGLDPLREVIGEDE